MISQPDISLDNTDRALLIFIFWWKEIQQNDKFYFSSEHTEDKSTNDPRLVWQSYSTSS